MEAGSATSKQKIHRNSSHIEGLDPHKYDSGRWLLNEGQELALRFIDFDFDALCSKLLELSGKQDLLNCEKIEGGSNRAFIFTFNDDRQLVAKLSFRVAGPATLITASEIATIQYLQKKTNIPIPQILDWSADASNPIGSEYIITEHAGGISVWEKWSSMTLKQRIRFIEAVYKQLKEVVKLEFPAYGSIYFDDEHVKLYPTKALEDGFCIGPHCGTQWWDIGKGNYYNHHKSPIREPLPDMLAYSNALIDNALAQVPAADPDPTTLERQLPFYHGSVETHLRLLEDARIVLNKLSKDTKVKYRARPTLFHPDLHKRNIFVSNDDPTLITAFIDWQSASVEPAFWYAGSTPDFVKNQTTHAVHIEPLSADSPESTQRSETRVGEETPGNVAATSREEQLETQVVQGVPGDAAEGNKEDEQPDSNDMNTDKEAEWYTRIFDVCMSMTNYTPQLGIAYATHANVFRPYHICGSTWKTDSGSLLLQHELIQLTREWTWLGLSGECPKPLYA
ncbi:hypothetical protein N7486_007366 [Penicillium sp. IBT 16267x]|nr:hypothetical protein N7486_007366 [Penicillium sp. IBT 16267x]